jgi:hypothetical protein
MRSVFNVLIIFFSPAILFAQQVPENSLYNSPNSGWSFSAMGYYSFIQGGKNTLTLMGYTNHKAFHAEARYNYEDQNTSSIFLGWQFKTGNKVQFAATPLTGAVFGNINGFVPGLELELDYKLFNLYSESEYVNDFAEKEKSFFYTWSEFGIKPYKPFRAGISLQITRLYKTKLTVQHGLFAEYSFWKLTLGANYLNPFSTNNFIITSLSIDFKKNKRPKK